MCTPQAHQQACLWPQQQHLWTAWRPMRSHPHTCAAKRAAGCHFSSSPLTSHIGHHQHAAASSCIAGRASNRDDTALDSLEELEIAVPADQRPVNELAALKQSFLYDWAVLPLNDYVMRLSLVFAFFFLFVGAPIANQTFDPTQQLLEFVLSASTGSLVVTAVLTLRIYLGWAYVQERLRSAAVPYEETGWYDGQVFVKPPEVLTRDRLLASYQVKPVLAKLRQTLLGSGAILLATSVLLVGLIQSSTDEDGVYGRGAKPVPRQVTSDGVLYGKRVKELSDLLNDDELAAEEAAAQGGIPGYCNDRMLRAFAGGQYCRKFDR